MAEAPPSDVGLGRARVDTKTRMALGLDSEGIVEALGRKATAARLFRVTQEDEGKGIIRIDGLVRRNADVSIGDEVEVRKAEVFPAERVTIAPIISEGHNISFGQGIENFVKRGLKRPLAKGDAVVVPGIALWGTALPFMVTGTAPDGIVEVGEETKLIVREDPVMEAAFVAPDKVLPALVRALRATLAGFEDTIDQLPEPAGVPARKLKAEVLRLIEEEEKDEDRRRA